MRLEEKDMYAILASNQLNQVTAIGPFGSKGEALAAKEHLEDGYYGVDFLILRMESYESALDEYIDDKCKW